MKKLIFIIFVFWSFAGFSQTLLNFESKYDGLIWIYVNDDDSLYHTSLDSTVLTPNNTEFDNMLGTFIPQGKKLSSYIYQDKSQSWTVDRIIIRYDDDDKQLIVNISSLTSDEKIIVTNLKNKIISLL